MECLTPGESRRGEIPRMQLETSNNVKQKGSEASVRVEEDVD